MPDKSFTVSVEPKVLIWARKSMGESIENVAHKLEVSEAEVRFWEQGKKHPRLTQLEKLAYNVYKRPLAVFFLPEPPKEKPLQQDFRTLPKKDIQTIPPEVRLEIRRAKRLQTLLGGLSENVSPNIIRFNEPLHKIFKVNLNNKVEKVANRLRDYLGISIEKQKAWKTSREAYNEFKSIVEQHNIFTFQFSLPVIKARGFSLIDDRFPVIAINSGDAVHGRIFTLFHEVCHILFNTGGIFRNVETKHLRGNAKKIEEFCNFFAASFLVPNQHLMNEPLVSNSSDEREWPDEDLVRLSKLYKVSTEVILRRLLYLNLTSKEFYEKNKNKWDVLVMKERKTKKDGFQPPADKCISEKGKTFISLVLDNYNKGNITYSDVSDYLGVKLNHLPKIIDLLGR